MSPDAAGRDDASIAPAGRPGVAQETALDQDPEQLAAIEAACRQFQGDLWADRRPRIEDAWTVRGEPGDPTLLKALVTLEVAYRRHAGQRPEPSEYHTRFPGQERAIAAAFEAAPESTEAVTVQPRTLVQGGTLVEGPSSGTLVTEPGTPVAELSPPPAEHTAVPGAITVPDLEILGELGGGGQAVVFRAHDRRRGQVVALKVLPRASPSALYRFKQEFRTLADVTHPNLVCLYELFSDGQQWSFTMELVDGVDLLAFLRSETEAEPEAEAAPALPRLRATFRQLAEGVAALHAAGHVHRDLKPSNVMVTRAGRVVILDMGIAVELDRAGLHESTEPQIIGTVPYMSPEQAAGTAISTASDWYSVGVMLFEALTGQRPYQGGTFAILVDKQNVDAPAPRTLAPGIPDDLDALCVELLRRDPRARPSDREVLRRLSGSGSAAGACDGAAPAAAGPGVSAAAAPASLSLPLIGREHHLATLATALETAKRRTVVCSVHGRSGVGKSALVQRFLDDLAAGRDDDPVVLAGRCYEQESVPYKAFDSLVDALSRYLKRLPRWEAEALLPRDIQLLGRVFPVLRRVAAVGEAPHRALETPDPHELRQRAFTALRELLARLGDRKPLILAIDDLQWADVDSAALLSDLLRPPDPPIFLLLACYRSEEGAANPFLQALRAAGAAPAPAKAPLERCELAVEALTPEQSSALARTLLGRSTEEPGDTFDAQAEAIARESGGNPLFVAELVNFVQSGVGAGLSGAAPRAIALDQVLWDRVVRLPEPARRLLEVVAVSGQPLSQTAAARAVALGPDERGALAVLRAGRLIRSSAQGTSTSKTPAEKEVIETYHDRIRETVVAHLDPALRQECHRRLALALVDSGEIDAETLAVHFQEANDPGRAAAYYARAADQAAESLAFDRAAKLYRLALDLRPAAAEPAADAVSEAPEETHRRLRTRLGDALANAGRGAEAAREYLAARQGAPVALGLELERRAALQFLISGYVDEGVAVLRTVLRAVGMTLPSTPRRAFRSLVLARLRLRLRGLGFQARDPSEVSPEELTRIDICWAGVAGLSMVDPIPAAVFQTHNMLLALRAGEPYRLARAFAMQAFHAASAGGRSRARTLRLLRDAQELAERVGHPHALGMVALASGVAAYCVGRWKEAHEGCERATAIFRSRCTGVAWELTTARVISLPSLIWLGEHAEAFRRLRLYRQEAQERGELYSLASVGAFGVHERLVADEPERAREDLGAVMCTWSRQGFHMQHMEELWVESHIDLYREDGDAAWERMTRQWPALWRSLLMRVQLIRIGMRHLRARCALAKAVALANTGGDPRPLLTTAERDARRMEREGMPWGNALALLIHAGVAAGRGDRTSAMARLASAVTALESADTRYPAVVARRRLAELTGGDEGRALFDQVSSWMTAQNIRNPDRYSAMITPGFRR